MIKTRTKPNILIICSDQHNPYITGCYGDSIIDTPNLDRLANEGIRFENAYCNNPLCVPSRMSFMTGLYPFRNECLDNGSVLDSRIPTFAHMLTTAGYHTVMSGRMHFVGPDQTHGHLERIHSEMGNYEIFNGNIDFSPLKGSLGNMGSPDPLLEVGAGNTSYLDFDQSVTQRTCEWLQKYSDTNTEIPFLMTVGLISPHCPYICPPDLFNKYNEQISFQELTSDELSALHPLHHQYRENIEISKVSIENQRKAKVAYYGLVDFLDTQIGIIIDQLESSGLLDNTIIIYFSDHGEMLGEHGRWHKGCFFEESVKVPLIIRVPEGLNKGAGISQNVSLIDLFPTLCDLSDTEIHHSIDGKSLVPLMNGDKSTWSNVVKAESYNCVNSSRMIRKDDWKLFYYSNYETGELYNLADDPNELNNRFSDPACSKIKKELTDLVFNDGWTINILKERDEKLTKYGYWKVLAGFRKAVNNDPLLTDPPEYWAKDRASNNWLV